MEVKIIVFIFLLTIQIAPGFKGHENKRSNSLLHRHKRLADLRKSTLTDMIPQQSCYYQEYNQRLTCTCSSSDASSFLHLNMKYYVFDAKNKIKSVHIRSCKRLLVNLDLKMVDATEVPFYFRAVSTVQIEQIQFEPAYSDTQELQLFFNNVETILLKNLHVEDTLKMQATNIKEAHLVGSTFAHIPTHGIAISGAKTLNIRNSKFLRVSEASVTVENTKEVTVVKNEMSKNAMEVVVAKDGSHLMISCNRLFGSPESPECSRIEFTTTSTTSTTTPSTYLVNQQGNLREQDGKVQDGGSGGVGIELIGGIVAGVLVILIAISCFICYIVAKKKKKQNEGEDGGEEVVPMKEETEEQKEKLLGKKENKDDSEIELGHEDDNVDEETGPRFSAPIWLEEIQKNKIFNKQKSLLSEEGLKEIAEGKKLPAALDHEQPENNTLLREEEKQQQQQQQLLLQQQQEQNQKRLNKKSHAPPPPVAAKPAGPTANSLDTTNKCHPEGEEEEVEVKESSRTESEEEVDQHQHKLTESSNNEDVPLIVSPTAEKMVKVNGGSPLHENDVSL